MPRARRASLCGGGKNYRQRRRRPYNQLCNDTAEGDVSSGGVTGGDGRVIGGATGTGNVSYSRVNVNDGSADGSIFGGWVGGTGNVTGNGVTMNSGTAKNTVTGGYTVSGTASYNDVQISGGTVTGAVCGGKIDIGFVTNNNVTVPGGGIVRDFVFVGYSESGASSGNRVTISGGTANGGIAGGYSASGSATGNSVIVSGSPTFDMAVNKDTDITLPSVANFDAGDNRYGADLPDGARRLGGVLQ